MSFVGKAIVPDGAMEIATLSHGEPSLPQAFLWDDERLEVRVLVKTWRSTKEDRGDVYLKKHWFEFETTDGRIAVVYFDRGAMRDKPRWYLYTLSSRA
jgi:hypothetical protein